MTPTTQTKFPVKDSNNKFIVSGNCYAASIASLLNLPITEVPNVEVLFGLDGKDRFFWDDVMNKWLEHKGYRLLPSFEFSMFHPDKFKPDMYFQCDKEDLEDRYYLVTGTSPRDQEMYHIVIYQNGQLVHDPHPSGEGVAKITNFQELIRLDQ